MGWTPKRQDVNFSETGLKPGLPDGILVLHIPRGVSEYPCQFLIRRRWQFGCKPYGTESRRAH